MILCLLQRRKNEAQRGGVTGPRSHSHEQQCWALPLLRAHALCIVPTPSLPWLGTNGDGIGLVGAGRRTKVDNCSSDPGPGAWGKQADGMALPCLCQSVWRSLGWAAAQPE